MISLCSTSATIFHDPGSSVCSIKELAIGNCPYSSIISLPATSGLTVVPLLALDDSSDVFVIICKCFCEGIEFVSAKLSICSRVSLSRYVKL